MSHGSGQPRNVSGFCQVVTWRPPLTAGTSTRLGYVVRLFIPGTNGDIWIKKAAGELYHIIQDSDKSNSLTEYFVQVATISEIHTAENYVQLLLCTCRCDLLLEFLMALGVWLYHWVISVNF